MRAILLFIPSTLVVLAMVLHSLKVRGARQTWQFFLFGLLFGIARGNIIWWITVVHFEDRFPYIFTRKLIGFYHDALQADIGWILTCYLGWCFAERILRRVTGRERSLWHTVGLAALFAVCLCYAVETTAQAVDWWQWNVNVKSRFVVEVPMAGIAAWFSVPVDFLLPFLVLTRLLPGRRVSPLPAWSSLAIFPLHMLVHAFGQRLGVLVPLTPYNVWYWTTTLLVLVLPLTRGVEMPAYPARPRGSARIPAWVVEVVPAVSILVVIGVLVGADLLVAKRPALLYSVLPLAFFTLLVYRPLSPRTLLAVGVVALAAGYGLQALGIAPRVAIGGPLLPIFVIALAVALWTGEPRLRGAWRPALVYALPVLLTAIFLVDAQARDRVDRRYHDLCGRAGALAKEGDLDRAAALYGEAVALRPNSLRAYQELALVQVNRKDYAAAADLYRHLNDLRPVSPEIMTNLGNVHALAGDYPRAIEAYRTALRFDPGFRTAREALAQVEAALKASGR